MPMFDDPRKELQRLQQELLAEEEEMEPDFPEEDDWLDRELAEAKALSGYQEPAQPQVRNYANGYGAGSRPAARQIPAQPQQRTYMSGYSAYREERPDYRGNMDRYDEEIEEEENSIRGLVALACLLTAGILGVALYWVFVLL